MQNAVWTAHARQSVRRLCLFVSVLLAGAVLLAVPGQTGAKEGVNKPTLEQALKDKASEIQQFLWEKMDHPKDCLHIGVLKFQVQVGNGPLSKNAGPLNLYMARRLEVALILSLCQQEDRIRILHNPGEQVKTTTDLTEKRGREVFFGERRYRPAWWGNKQEDIPAHVFLTGEVKIQEEGETAEILIRAFDRRCEAPVKGCAFQTATDPRMLTESGASFVLSRGSIDDWKVVMSNTQPAKADQKRPTARELLRQAPIDFQILYNGVQQPIAEDGTVPEPTSKDAVTFRLKHNERDTKTYGVILKVNGLNTLWPDDADADDDFFRCYKWLVKPHGNFEVKGFQTGQETAKAFTVLSAKESRQKKLYYGEHAGTFTVIILEGKDNDEKPPVMPDRPRDEVAIAHGVPNGLNDFGSLKALQDRLLAKPQPAEGKVVPKGIIEAGDKEKEHRVNLEPFDASAKRIPVIQIRYYKP
jgi:hypothetical protein